MLNTERKRNSDLQQSLELQRSQLNSKSSEINAFEIKNSDLQPIIELQQKQLHSKVSKIGILKRYHVAEVKSLKEKVSSLKECENVNLSLEYYQNIKINGVKQQSTGVKEFCSDIKLPAEDGE